MRRSAIAVAFLAAGIVAVHAQNNFIYKAPTPADWAALAKLPDFSGVWEVGFGPPAGGARAGGARPGGARGAAAAAPGGGRGRSGGPQLTPAAEARRKELQAKAGNVQDSPAANCLPPGMPGIMGQPYPMEFLLTPGKVTIVIEAYQQVRHIYTDGRPLPDDPDLKFHGTSIGRWDGDTLVVESSGFRDGGWLDIQGSPLTDAAKMTERWRRLNYGTIQIDVTIDDPKAYTRPFTIRVHHRLMMDSKFDAELIEFICQENNKAPQLMVGK